MKIVCTERPTCDISTLKPGDVFRDSDREVMMITNTGCVSLEDGAVYELKNLGTRNGVVPLPDAKLITGES